MAWHGAWQTPAKSQPKATTQWSSWHNAPPKKGRARAASSAGGRPWVVCAGCARWRYWDKIYYEPQCQCGRPWVAAAPTSAEPTGVEPAPSPPTLEERLWAKLAAALPPEEFAAFRHEAVPEPAPPTDQDQAKRHKELARQFKQAGERKLQLQAKAEKLEQSLADTRAALATAQEDFERLETELRVSTEAWAKVVNAAAAKTPSPPDPSGPPGPESTDPSARMDVDPGDDRDYDEEAEAQKRALVASLPADKRDLLDAFEVVVGKRRKKGAVAAAKAAAAGMVSALVAQGSAAPPAAAGPANPAQAQSGPAMPAPQQG